MKATVQEMLSKLEDQDVLFSKAFEHGSMYVELYRPDKADHQTPHEQDELYVVVSGSGAFINGGSQTVFGPGDVLFAKAGVIHRFENFTDDFVTWVIFYGPKGGE